MTDRLLSMWIYFYVEYTHEYISAIVPPVNIAGAKDIGVNIYRLMAIEIFQLLHRLTPQCMEISLQKNATPCSL